MAEAPQLCTDRLVLRRWRACDRAPFAALNADPAVAATLAGPLSASQSDGLIERIEDGFERHGFGLWALELADTGAFLGFTGLSVPAFKAPFLPAVEIGWRLAPSAWGHGYATEAARGALAYGFAVVGLTAIVSFTAKTNARSQAVMRRLGMVSNPTEDFDHPAVPVGHPLRRHVLYRAYPGTPKHRAPAPVGPTT